MPPKARLAQALRWAARAARIGGAWLGFAVLVSSAAPGPVVTVLIVALVLVGGTARTTPGPRAVRLFGPLLCVLLARLALGPLAAALAGVLLALGAWLRIRPADTTTGLAVFGGVVILLGGASAQLVFAFWLLGLAVLALRDVTSRIRRRAAHLSGLRGLTADSRS